MTSEGTGAGGVPGPHKRQVTDEQRRYNRRAPVSDLSPPYYDVFERIALALEGVERALSEGAVSGRSAPSTDLRIEGRPRERLTPKRPRTGSKPSAGPAPRSGEDPG